MLESSWPELVLHISRPQIVTVYGTPSLEAGIAKPSVSRRHHKASFSQPQLSDSWKKAVFNISSQSGVSSRLIPEQQSQQFSPFIRVFAVQ